MASAVQSSNESIDADSRGKGLSNAWSLSKVSEASEEEHNISLELIEFDPSTQEQSATNSEWIAHRSLILAYRDRQNVFDFDAFESEHNISLEQIKYSPS